MPEDRLQLGRRGEDEALLFLEQQGYRILTRNYKSKLGEIDIVAKDKDTICFVEVKSRSSESFGSPEEAVLKSKQRQISKAALSYLKEKKLLQKRARFDVVSLLYSDGIRKLSLIKNAFELAEGYSY